MPAPKDLFVWRVTSSKVRRNEVLLPAGTARRWVVSSGRTLVTTEPVVVVTRIAWTAGRHLPSSSSRTSMYGTLVAVGTSTSIQPPMEPFSGSGETDQAVNGRPSTAAGGATSGRE